MELVNAYYRTALEYPSYRLSNRSQLYKDDVESRIVRGAKTRSTIEIAECSTVLTISASLAFSFRFKWPATQMEFMKVQQCGYSTFLEKRAGAAPTNLPLRPARAVHVKKGNRRHTAKSSVICWPRTQRVTSSPRQTRKS